MKPLKPPRDRGDRWIFAGLLALLFWLPLPWGSNTPWSAALLATLSLSLVSMWLMLAALGVVRPGYKLSRLAAPALWWALWLGWLGLALLPMSLDALGRWSPAAAQLYGQAGALIDGVTPRISIAPGATAAAWLLSAGYAALYFLVMLTCIRRPDRIRLVLLTIVVAGLAQALYGSLMVLSGLEYGFFREKLFYRDVATGTFVNRNHLAGYLQLAGAAALGLILADLSIDGGARSWRQRALDFIAWAFSPKVRIRIVLVIMAVALVMTRSRMGNIAFFAALVICGMGYILLRHRQLAFRAFLLFSSVILIDLLIVSQWYGLEQLVERIETTEMEGEGRTQFLEEVPPVIETYWQAGAGLGAFAQAYAPYRSPQMRQYFDHAHNDYIEFLIETGAPGLLLLASFVLAHAVHALRVVRLRRCRLGGAAAFAALMSMTAVGIHSLTDFNLQIPANAATLIGLMALVAACSSEAAPRRQKLDDDAQELA